MMKMMMMKRILGRHNYGRSSSLILGEDIMCEIFLWLPLQSLVRFKTLSKRCYFLIAHKDSYFRRNYFSTLSTRKRNRIVGSFDFHPFMPGFFYQSPPLTTFVPYFTSTYDRIRFLTTTTNSSTCSSQFTTTLDESFVTMEWFALPALETNTKPILVGFVCKGDYPSLDLVEYTIVRSSWLNKGEDLLFEFFSSNGTGTGTGTGTDNNNNKWRDYICSCKSLGKSFTLLERQNPVIVTNDQGAGGIVVCLLVMLRSTKDTAILVFDLNKLVGREEDSLQIIHTPPGPIRGTSALQCIDYIREFDGVIHYVRLRSLKYFEFWVLNIEERRWRMKHQARLQTMMEGYPWTDVGQYNVSSEHYHIHAFHPTNPNLIFLTLYNRMVCYNIETRTLELVQDFFAQNMLDDYNHHVYQWPCWPPLI